MARSQDELYASLGNEGMRILRNYTLQRCPHWDVLHSVMHRETLRDFVRVYRQGRGSSDDEAQQVVPERADREDGNNSDATTISS
ncbi:hypothetical protein PtB15_1B98 [Puccinia triticina]|nr:hypothetical protein PtB15_1B98 [Puccinia triticina]